MAKLLKDYTGYVFGELTVIGFAGRDKGGRALWHCSCSCGGELITLAHALLHGHTFSCGHRRRGRATLRMPLTSAQGRPVRHPLYVVWNNMINRCYNVNNKNYSAYGGRGILVCRRWHFYANFYDDNIGQWRRRLQIDRVDNDKGYWPLNVRFVTGRVNMQNTQAAKRRRIVADLVLQKLRELK